MRTRGSLHTTLRPNIGEAIVFLLAGVFLIGLMDADIKYLSQKFHVLQLTWSRYFFQITALLAASPWVGFWSYLKTRELKLNLGRALLLLVSSLCFFTAIHFISLAIANAISFLAPLLMTILAIPFHGERVDSRRWAAVIVGFIGAVLMIRPGWGVFQWAACLPLVMALCSALYHVTTPLLGVRDNPVKTLYYTGLLGTVTFGMGMPFVWVTPKPLEWLMMAAVGILGLSGHYLLIQAFNRGPTPLLSPFLYTYLIWAVLYDYIFFNHLPGIGMVTGGTAIIAGGIYIYFRELKSSR
jgi:drug/metabolite transporter (DMT)-like permease